MARRIAGLGHLGLSEKARQEFAQVLQASPDYLGATTTLARID